MHLITIQNQIRNETIICISERITHTQEVVFMFHKNCDITVFTELARQKNNLTGVRGRSLS